MPETGIPTTPDGVLTSTRAVRRRLDLDRPVERQLVEECVAAAVQAPTGSNKQSWHFLVVDDPAKREALAEIYRRAFAHYRTFAAGSPDSDGDQSLAARRVFASAEHLAENLHRAPYLVVTALDGRCEDLGDPYRQSAFWGGIMPATWSFMLAARARGLGTAWTSMHLQFEEEAAAVLGIPFATVTQACLTPVAHTVGTDFKPAHRKPLESVLHWNGW
jgi:nitroreductase